MVAAGSVLFAAEAVRRVACFLPPIMEHDKEAFQPHYDSEGGAGTPSREKTPASPPGAGLLREREPPRKKKKERRSAQEERMDRLLDGLDNMKDFMATMAESMKTLGSSVSRPRSPNRDPDMSVRSRSASHTHHARGHRDIPENGDGEHQQSPQRQDTGAHDMSLSDPESGDDMDLEGAQWALLATVGKSGDKPTEKPLAAADNLLADISQEFEQEAEGPALNTQLASFVNKTWSDKLPENKIDEKEKHYVRPENTHRLQVPKVNPKIWRQMGHRHKGQDLAMQRAQRALVKGAIPVAILANSLLESRKNEEVSDADKLIRLATDSLALLGHASRELSVRRRDAIRPALNTDYAVLCSNQIPIGTEMLFGDDLPKNMRDIKDACVITKQVSRTPTKFSGKGTRAGSSHRPYGGQSYGAGNWQRGPFLEKGPRHDPPGKRKWGKPNGKRGRRN